MAEIKLQLKLLVKEQKRIAFKYKFGAGREFNYKQGKKSES
jgi:hypothetical protein